jgi:DnaJ-domain-containing protein 1
VGSFKRLVDIARAEVGSVLEKAEKGVERVSERVTGKAGRPLDEFSDDELSAEIERRRLQKEQRETADAKKAAQDAKKARTEPAAKATAAADEPSAAPPPRRPRVTGGIDQYYANLELEPGADLETIKRAYRRLMRKYHPDKHAGDPAKFKAATELAQNLTKAYMELKKHLEGG